MCDNSTVIINCLNGSQLDLNLSTFVSLNSFKKFIGTKWKIPIQDIFIITPFGVKLKEEDFHTKTSLDLLNHIYVFHRKMFSNVQKPILHTDAESHAEKKTQAIATKVEEQGLNQKTDFQEHAPEGFIKLSDQQINKMLDDLDPLPTLLRPMPSPLQDFPLDEEVFQKRKTQLRSIMQTNMGWLKALKIDITYYFEQITSFIESKKTFTSSIDIIMNYLQLYCEQINTLYLEKLSTNDTKNDGNIENWKENYDFLGKLECVVQQRNFNTLKEYFDYKKLNNNYNEYLHFKDVLNKFLKIMDIQMSDNLNLEKILFSNSDILKLELSKLFQIDMSLENNLFDNFNDYITKIESLTTEILAHDFNEGGELQSEIDTQQKLNVLIKNLIPQITIISVSIFAKTNEIMDIKRKIQKSLIRYLGQVTYVQMDSLNLKKKIIQDLDYKMMNVQKFQSIFNQLKDFPIFYGVFLLELYRRKKWMEQVLKLTNNKYNSNLKSLQKNELKKRNAWLKNVQERTSLKDSDYITPNNEYVLEVLLNIENKDCVVISDIIHESEFQLSSIKNYYNINESMLQDYCNKLIKYGISQDLIYSTLVQPLKDLDHYPIDPENLISKQRNDNDKNVTVNEELLNDYKERIKRLETQLFTQKIGNTHDWPIGIFNDRTHNMDWNNIFNTSLQDGLLGHSISNVVYTTHLGHPASLDPNESKNLLLQHESEVSDLKKELEASNLQNQELLQELKNCKLKMIDLETENNAYKESLSISNNAMLKYTNEIEALKKDNLEVSSKFKQDLRILLNQNNKNFKEYDILQKQYEKLNISKKEITETMENMEKSFENEKLILNNNIIEYQNQIREIDTITKEISENQEKLSKNKQLFSQYIHELFSIVMNDIFILENIGLLLEGNLSNKDEVLSINRVKGLRKKLDETTILSLESPTLEMNSSLVKEVKTMKTNIDTENPDELIMFQFLQFIKKLYNNDTKLFGTSVVKRFKDVEQLAKKLTKENKKIKTHFNENGIVVGDLSVGDLALFLPAKLDRDYVGDFSSVSSSMSSIDLGSSPAPNSMSESDPTYEKKPNTSNTITTSTIINHPYASLSKGIPPTKVWTAFTAFGNTRYIVKDTVPIKGEWFIAEISALEKHITSSTDNPYKLDIGVTWYGVSVKPVQRN